MGKRKGTKSAYEHNHTYNPSARESDDRRLSQLRGMEIKRLQKSVEKQERLMEEYIPAEQRKRKRVDPNYNLKGAARPALDFYKDPNAQPEVEPVDLLSKYDTCMWDHEEGRVLLSCLLELAIGLHNIAERSKEAVKVFERILRHDPDDHLLARRALLRCYMDMGWAAEARQLVEVRFPSDTSACFAYAGAFVEFVSFSLLQEEGSSKDLADEALKKAVKVNPYVVWVLVHHEYFAEAVDYLEDLERCLGESISPGGPLEALLFLYEDVALWRETEGSVEWVAEFASSHPDLVPFPPSLDSTPAHVPAVENPKEDSSSEQQLDNTSNNEDESDDSSGMDEDEATEMYLTMYKTAIEMAMDGMS
mmetsp:Transcript_380/g.693  ORF Transcript_380/g.693 Transcript_380/m.693 type:complete len:363 (-) Transcript_380:57-1145(-)